MLKRTIQYEDFNGDKQEEVFYFNISKPELIALEVDHPKGFGAWMDEVMKAKDNKTLIEQFKRIVLLAYGEKTEDGKNFVKNDELKAKFESSAAYIALFTELASNDNAAAEFLLGVLPKDMTAKSREALAAEAAAATTPAPSV